MGRAIGPTRRCQVAMPMHKLELNSSNGRTLVNTFGRCLRRFMSCVGSSPGSVMPFAWICARSMFEMFMGADPAGAGAEDKVESWLGAPDAIGDDNWCPGGDFKKIYGLCVYRKRLPGPWNVLNTPYAFGESGKRNRAEKVRQWECCLGEESRKDP